MPSQQIVNSSIDAEVQFTSFRGIHIDLVATSKASVDRQTSVFSVCPLNRHVWTKDLDSRQGDYFRRWFWVWDAPFTRQNCAGRHRFDAGNITETSSRHVKPIVVFVRKMWRDVAVGVFEPIYVRSSPSSGPRRHCNRHSALKSMLCHS